MKKYCSFLMMAVASFAFIACEDVPEPYGINLLSSTSQEDVLLSESFATSLGKFTSQTTSGDGAWVIDYSTAKAAGYDNATKVTTAGTYYLVSPEIDLTAVDAAHVSFEYILRYLRNAEDQRVLISSDYNGDAATATWTALPVTLVEGSDWSTFTTADVDVPAEYIGKKVRIALYYSCGSSNSSTWEVKNLKVLKGKAGGDTPEPVDPDVVVTLPYEESFASSFGNFVSKTTSGSGNWIIDYSTAKATGYDGNTKVTTAGRYYLLSPAIDLTGVTAAHVAYEYILRYNKGDENQQVLISSDYVDDIKSATFVVLKKQHVEGSDWNTFSNANITIPEAFLGKVIRIAFLYNTNATSGSTWEVKNFSITDGEGSEAAEGSSYVDGGDTPGPQPGEGAINETFASSLGVFSNVSVVGSYAWHIDYSCAQITSYDSSSKTNNDADAYLVSAPVTLENEAYHITFEYILRYALDATVKDNHQVLVTTAYTGNPATTNWTVLPFTAQQGSNWNTWYNTDLDIPAEMQGQPVVVALRYVGTTEKAGTWEVRNFVLAKGSSGGDTPQPQPGEGKGTGTLDDPYNAVKATEVATALGSGNTSTESYYIKGKISEVKYTFDAEHGTATFFISDDGAKTNQFQVYSTYYLGNRSWQNGDTQIAVGDDVIIYGQLTNYNGTPETAAKKSCLYSLNGVTDGGTPGPGPGPDPGTGIKLEDFTNGDFEAWDNDTQPTGWSSVAGNATLQKSTDAHGGDFSVLVKGAAANKRMAYQEMSLEAGTYTLSCYAKAATTDAAVIRIGYAKLTNGVVADTQNDYIYNDMTTINNGDWQLVTYQFTLSAPTAVSLLVMNNKQGGKDVLIDDVTITKE